MNTKFKLLKTVLGILVLLLYTNGNAQNFAYWNDIQSFKKQDSIAMPAQYKTLFIGSSSFTIWKTLYKDLPEYAPLNRAFGGSTLLDVIRYRKDIIDKYSPTKIIIYCGENDIASSDTVAGSIVLNRFKVLYAHIREKFPTIKIYYISIKPSPSRWSMKERMLDANRQIKGFCKQQKNTYYLSVWSQMLQNAKPNPSLFKEDNLHMNTKGYEIWIKEIRKRIKN